MRRLLILLALCFPSFVTAQTLTTIIIPDKGEDDEYNKAFDDSANTIQGKNAFARLFADGAVRGGVTGETTKAGAATGSLGIQVASRLGGKRADATFLVSVIGAADSVSADYGAVLLAPASGNTLSAGLIDVRIRDVVLVDLRMYGSVSTSDWSVPVDENGLFDLEGTHQTFSAGVIGVGILLGETILAGRMAENTTAAVTLDAGLSLRSLFGDVVNGSNNAFRESLFPGEATTRLGIEISLGIQISGVKAGVSYYHYGGDIAGFSNGQVVAGIGLQTPIVSGTLRRTAPDS